MIVVSDMEKLPENCHLCGFSFYEGNEWWCSWHNCTVDYHGGAEKRMISCPLSEVEE